MSGFRFAVQLLKQFISIVFQTECIICGKNSSDIICENCFCLEKISSKICDRCGRELLGNLTQCQYCLNSSLLRVRSLFFLNDSMKKFLYLVKFGGYKEYLKIFKTHIVNNLLFFFPKNIVIVPIPSSFYRYWQRKFNQSEIIASYLAEAYNLPVNFRAFIKIRNTEPQRLLPRKKRITNLKGSFLWISKEKPENVLLVDDVYTTGSTLETSAKAIKKAGIKNIYGWTLFRTPFD